MFKIKQNDTLPYLEAQLLDNEDKPIDLTLSAVKFHMINYYKSDVIINRLIDIDNELDGKVSVKWLDGETSIPGKYKCEFQVTLADGNITTVPNDDYFELTIVPELA